MKIVKRIWLIIKDLCPCDIFCFKHIGTTLNIIYSGYICFHLEETPGEHCTQLPLSFLLFPAPFLWGVEAAAWFWNTAWEAFCPSISDVIFFFFQFSSLGNTNSIVWQWLRRHGSAQSVNSVFGFLQCPLITVTRKWKWCASFSPVTKPYLRKYTAWTTGQTGSSAFCSCLFYLPEFCAFQLPFA